MKPLKCSSVVATLCSLLSACRGTGSNAESNEGDIVAIYDASVLVGQWDSSEIDEDGEDISCTLFSAKGDADLYDYNLDDYSDGQNCHHKISYRLRNYGDGKYEYQSQGFPARLHFSVLEGLIEVRDQATDSDL